MTTRVYDFQRPAAVLVAPPRPTAEERRRRRSNVRTATLLSLVLVPMVGAAEAPGGWLVAGASALVLILLGALAGGRVPWGWLAVILGGAGYALPRGQWSVIGPALFVATTLCVLFWVYHLRGDRRPDGDRPRVGSRERAAQVSMGISGERHVGHVLASALPQEYALLNGLKLPRGAGDIDHLVVGPSGVFLLETKTMQGQIVCEPDGTWRRTRFGPGGAQYSAFIGDPAAQVQRNIFAVRAVLQRRLPHLLQTTGLWIEGLVVFAHRRTELKTASSRVPAVVLDQAVDRISQHTPHHRLEPADVEAIVAALLDEARTDYRLTARRSAQALVEVALALPLVLGVVLGTIAVSRVVQAHTAIVGVAHEAARAAALARTPSEAIDRMRQRADLVAPGLGLQSGLLVVEWDLTRFSQDPGEVVAFIEYPVDLSDLPLVAGMPAPIVRAEHVEWVDPFRSGNTAVGAPSR